MELYIIRHGDPDYVNDTLTEEGREQAKLLAEHMIEIKPDKIYSSPRGSAKDTAKLTCEKLDMTYNIEDWTTENLDYMEYPTVLKGKKPKCTWKTDLYDGVHCFKDYSIEDREYTLDELQICSDYFFQRHGYERQGLVYRIIKPNDKKIVIFCHEGFGSAWIAHLISLPPAMGWVHFTLHTASITKFIFENTKNGFTFPQCIYFNSINHLRS